MKENYKLFNIASIVLCIILITIMLTFNTISLITDTKLLNFILYGVILLFILLLIISTIFKKDSLFKLCVVGSFVCFFCVLLYFTLEQNDLLDKFTSISSIKDIINRAGVMGKVVFLIINILQVIILPIPGVITIMVGTSLFGNLATIILCTIGITVGSIISFFIGRIFGKNLCYWIFGKEKVNKYQQVLSSKKWEVALFLMFVLPFFPDDLLCLISGLTKIKFKRFLTITIISRMIAVASFSLGITGIFMSFKNISIPTFIIIASIILLTLIIVLKKRKIIKNKIMILFKD